jgi:hypothetical protein
MRGTNIFLVAICGTIIFFVAISGINTTVCHGQQYKFDSG